MPLSKEQVEQVARLARLNLTPAEIESYTSELTLIIRYIDQLSSVDVTGVEPREQFITADNVFRDDVAVLSLPQKAALANAPKRDDGYFVVPKVIG